MVRCAFTPRRLICKHATGGVLHPSFTQDIKAETDQLTHVYTLRVMPNNTFEVYIDTNLVDSGSLFDDFDMLPPKKIKASLFCHHAQAVFTLQATRTPCTHVPLSTPLCMHTVA
jgi:hypothetical protein